MKPARVTDTAPVTGTFAGRACVMFTRSYENSRVTEPVVRPADTATVNPRPRPADTTHVTELSERQPLISHAVAPTRTRAVTSTVARDDPNRVTRVCPDVGPLVSDDVLTTRLL